MVVLPCVPDTATVRADAVSVGDGGGLFVNDVTRSTGGKVGKQWVGYPVFTSTQVSQAYQRGTSAADLSYIVGGCWADMLIGMHGAVELVANDKGDEAFKKNQTLIRALAFADVNLRREASFVIYKLVRRAAK